MEPDVDALVVGGAAAGLSAALVLGRARVPTLVIDAGEPSNRAAQEIGGLLGQAHTSPAELYAAGRAQLAELPTVELRPGSVTAIERGGGDGAGPLFRATLAGGAQVTARRVLLAAGMRYAVPDIPGLAPLWGTVAFACPYCHGWENRDRRIVLLGSAGIGHRIDLLRGWSADLVVASGEPLAEEDRAAVLAAGLELHEEAILAVEPGLVRLAGGKELAAQALHVIAPMEPRDGLVASLGLAVTDLPFGTGLVDTDRWGVTSVPGIFAAGDQAGAGNVAAAIATGNLAATGLHRTLLTGLPV